MIIYQRCDTIYNIQYKDVTKHLHHRIFLFLCFCSIPSFLSTWGFRVVSRLCYNIGHNWWQSLFSVLFCQIIVGGIGSLLSIHPLISWVFPANLTQKIDQMYASFTGQPLERVQQFTERDRFLSVSEVTLLRSFSLPFLDLILIFEV